jgi:L-ribulose-5-phosphate 3-epimerase
LKNKEISMGTHYLETYANSGLYTMQGRLCAPEDGRFQSFPRSAWEREIELASQVPLRGIEWIYDLYGEGANPLESPQGRQALMGKLGQTGQKVVSICADYFMDCPLVHPDATVRAHRLEKMKWLISICQEMRIQRIVIPFVDASKITDHAATDTVLQVLNTVLPEAQAAGVELHLETDMGPAAFRAFLDEIEHPLVRVNYDSGNSSSLGYKPSEEFAAYGHRIGSFHIKDRVLGGKTVPLGQGDADFASLRAGLLDIDYQGDFVLQVARGEPGDELAWLALMNTVACQWLRGEALLHSEN